MSKGIWNAWKGRWIWYWLKIRYHINYNKVVVVFNTADSEWNQYAMLHLPDYMERKKAETAVILYSEKVDKTMLEPYARCRAVFIKVKEDKLQYLYGYYCLFRFFDNISFCFMEGSRDNHTKEILKEGTITKEEVICLCFFHLRSVPKIR